jgi:hypothetical protein
MRTKKVPQVPSLPVPVVSPLLYDISTTAQMLGTTIFAVRELCRSGRLKYITLGHRWMISPSFMEEFIRDAAKAAA